MSYADTEALKWPWSNSDDGMDDTQHHYLLQLHRERVRFRLQGDTYSV